MKAMLISMAVLFSTAAHAQHGGWFTGAWFGGNEEKSPVAGLTPEQYKRSIGACNHIFSLSPKSGKQVPPEACKCFVQRIFETLSVDDRKHLEAVIPEDFEQYSKSDVDELVDRLAPTDTPKIPTIGAVPEPPGSVPKPPSRAAKFAMPPQSKLAMQEASMSFSGDSAQNCFSGQDLGEPDPTKNVVADSSAAGETSTATVASNEPPAGGRAEAFDGVQLEDPRFIEATFNELNFLKCAQPEPWLRKCEFKKGNLKITATGDSKTRTIVYHFPMLDDVTTEISRITRLTGLPQSGLEQCARQGQAGFHNDFINLDCKASGFNHMMITQRQYHPPSTKRW